MSYLDRIKGVIELASPDGEEFTAKWGGNNRSGSKKLGIFSAPRVSGSVVQDLDLEAYRWPLTIFFDDEDHDLTADRFVNSLEQRGVWLIDHPTKGLKNFQLVSFTERIQPVTDGGYTQFDTDWIEPLPEGSVVITNQLADDMNNGGFLANISAAGQFVKNTIQDTQEAIRTLSVAAAQVVTNIRSTLFTIENFEIIPAEFEALVRGIQSTIDSVPINTDLLAGQITNIVQVFAPTSTSSTLGIEGYQQFTTAMSVESPSLPTVEGVNQIAVQELALAAANTAVAQSMLVGGEKTKKEALANTENILAFFINITNILDASQVLYRDLAIDLQYFSQSESYADSLNLAAITARYKFQAAFDLAVEKTIILKKDRTPIDIAMSEYSGEWDDLFLEEFYSINELVGDSMYLLHAGDEVVVYV